MKNKKIQLALAVAVSFGALWFAFRDVNFGELAERLRTMAWWPFLPYLAMLAVHLVLRALRWRYFLPAIEGNGGSVRQLFDALMLGNLATLVLPMRVGEFVRPLVLTKWTSYPLGTAFVSVLLERFFDLSAVLLSLACIAPMLPAFPPAALGAAYSLGGVALCILLFLTVGCFFPRQVQGFVEVVARFLPGPLQRFAVRFSGELLAGTAVIKTPQRLLAIVSLTAAVWITTYLQFYILLFLFPHEQSLLLSVALGVFVALAVALPSTPGFVGVFQAGIVAACALFGYPESAAQAYSLVAHFVSYVIMVLIGFWVLSVHGMKFGELRMEKT